MSMYDRFDVNFNLGLTASAIYIARGRDLCKDIFLFFEFILLNRNGRISKKKAHELCHAYAPSTFIVHINDNVFVYFTSLA
jgi:hypothetical protein